MASRKTLVSRLLGGLSKAPATISGPLSKAGIPPPAPSFLQKLLLRSPPQDGGSFRRFLHQNAPPLFPAQRLALPVGDKLIERLRVLNGDRIRLDTLAPPLPPDREVAAKKEEETARPSISVEEVKKVMRVSEMEAVKGRLRAVGKASISYSKYVQICKGDSSSEHGLGIARSLDEAGAVLVLGDVVFLRPDQVARAIESVIPRTRTRDADNDESAREELMDMERRKAEIDMKAEAGVRRELWCGLGFLVVQTLGFMRLTFWDLSWDVMEPICFYVTSVYFMAGYAFFLRTSRDPSFEGFFESRFAARQKRLMDRSDFDLRRLHDLRQAAGIGPAAPCRPHFVHHSCSSSHFCDCSRREGLIGGGPLEGSGRFYLSE